MRLANRVVLITGGARGIGAAIAAAYVKEGAVVIIADIEIERARQTATALGPGANAVRLDVTSLSDIDRVVSELDAVHSGIDILINNAGIFDMAPVTHVTEASYARQFDINVKGTIFMMKAVANAMIARNKKGKIINMASQAGRRGEALVLVYCATKAAVISLTQSAALALAPHGINVNAIAPGVIDTEMWDVVDGLFAKWEGLAKGEKKKQVGLAVPLGYMGKPEDIAGAAVFLGSTDADYITAQTLNVDGGNWMS